MKLSAIHFTLATVISAVAFTGFAHANHHEASTTKPVKATSSKEQATHKDSMHSDAKGTAKTAKTEAPAEQKVSAATTPATKEAATTGDSAKDAAKPAVVKTQTGQVSKLSPSGAEVKPLEKSTEKPAEKR